MMWNASKIATATISGISVAFPDTEEFRGDTTAKRVYVDYPITITINTKIRPESPEFDHHKATVHCPWS